MLTWLIVADVLAIAAWLVFRALGRPYLKYRGKRLITCPENRKPAAVDIDALHASATAVRGHVELRLASCTRWPEKRDCGQECLRQIETAPDGCLIKNIVTGWYANKSCALCGKPLGEIDWLEHKPGVIDDDRATREWSDIAPETVPDVMATYKPICWNCHVAETFRRQHPELVVDR